MRASPFHGMAVPALLAAGLLLSLAAAGWAAHGSDIFLATFMAGLASCF